jgi:hypothetical protein
LQAKKNLIEKKREEEEEISNKRGTQKQQKTYSNL